MKARDEDIALDILIDTIRDNPNMWEIRKKTASLLLRAERYVEAAEMVWNAPNIPFTDHDVAFTVKMTARGLPRVASKFVTEVLLRNKDKPLKHIAVARALNEEGFYMAAAKFYGAALAVDPDLFDEDFEKQALWMDDSGSIMKMWSQSEGNELSPLSLNNEEKLEGSFNPEDIVTSGEVKSAKSEANASSYLSHFSATSTPVPASTPSSSLTTPLQASALQQGPATTPLQVSPLQNRPLAVPAQGPATTPLQTSPLQRGPLTQPLKTAALQQPPSTAALLSPATQGLSAAPVALNTNLPAGSVQPRNVLGQTPRLKLK